MKKIDLGTCTAIFVSLEVLRRAFQIRWNGLTVRLTNRADLEWVNRSSRKVLIRGVVIEGIASPPLPYDEVEVVPTQIFRMPSGYTDITHDFEFADAMEIWKAKLERRMPVLERSKVGRRAP